MCLKSVVGGPVNSWWNSVSLHGSRVFVFCVLLIFYDLLGEAVYDYLWFGKIEDSSVRLMVIQLRLW